MKILLALALFFFIFASSVGAIEDPTSVPNNKFGIHIIDENDLDVARELVNSSGGDWGYVTFVIREDERNVGRWQNVFNKLRRMHLIPIVRVATTQGSGGWSKPDQSEIAPWVNFFDSLNWVIKNRYIIIGNEPNQAHEWGGEINPKEYGNYLLAFSKKLKEKNSDYFVLPAGFDASAPNSRSTMSEKRFLENMLKEAPNSLDFVDGWVSHSYPKGYMPAANQFGPASLRTYIWEEDLLKSLNVTKDLPVFITETGWKRNGEQEDIGGLYKDAFSTVWNDERIVAVTPFILNYKDELFSEFSWLAPDGQPYSFYYDVREISKTAGEPTQITAGEIKGVVNMPFVQTNHAVYGIIMVKNTGQSIWDAGRYAIDGVELLSLMYIEPNEDRILFFKTLADQGAGLFVRKVQLTRRGVKFGNTTEIYSRVLNIPPLLKLIFPPIPG